MWKPHCFQHHAPTHHTHTDQRVVVLQSLCYFIVNTLCPLARYTGLSTALTKRRPVPAKRAGVEPLTSFADLSRVAFPMVLYLGPHIATDPPLLVKLIRIGKAYMNKVGARKN